MTMKNRKNTTSWALAALVLLPSVLSLFGCGDDTAPAKEDSKKAEARLELATKQRELFDKYQGNYDAMTAEDKTKAAELFGSEQNARTAFQKMSPGGTSTQQK